MKKILWMILALLSSCSAYARQEVTVAEAKMLRDGRQVTLTGIISGRADDDHYWLKDATGLIRVDMDDDDDEHYLIGKKVRVTGEVDRDDGYNEINVDRVFILK
ncbi:NirD/YgiW/YdeI family stress tolerance protein [Pantoea agglomerans]|uniref:NirD/YgiW/YdeI family stress tolerance protein n=1 Tax=Enterobacter agglomerans TaxID=549 RepID=UPI0013C5661A|nr:NirD/YgiW/YdeI family stress tolerance protein [Pantoea agglomerans]NEG60606.1 NirD/YgiW/YdeI family stress tolerance protein [Pantoea agglomerans]NEH05289.1 NirD/YgiW/YdeI family stress tolerance protein [Pantoea agglomerans]